MKPRIILSLLLAIIVVGIVLRAVNIGKHSFWYDETLTLMYTDEPERLLPGGERGTDSPLYLTCLYLWSRFGESEGFLRALSLLFGVLTIPVLYRIGRELSGRPVGVVAAAILAASSLHAYYAQELRTYTLTTLLATCAVFFFIRMLKTHQTRYLVGFAILGLGATFTHYYAGILFVAANLYYFCLFSRHASLLKRWLIAHVLLAVAAIPIAIDFVNQLHWAQQIHWTKSVVAKDVPLMFNHFSFGYYVVDTNLRKVCFVVAVGLFAFGLYKAIVARPTGVSTQRVAISLLLSLFALVPIVVVLVASLLIQPAFLTRYFLFCSPLIFLTQAIALVAIKPRALAAGLGVFVLAINGISFHGLYTNGTINDVEGVYQKRDNREMAQFILDRAAEGDAIVHSLDSTAVPIRRYCRDEAIQNILLVFSGRESSGVSFPGLENEKFVEPLKDRSPLTEYQRLWYIKGWWVHEGDPFCQVTAGPAIQWLDENYDKEPVDQGFNGGRIYLYTRKN